MLRGTAQLCSYYLPVVGCAFLVDTLYGCKYSAHIGMCSLPYVYVKTVLFCISEREMQGRGRKYVHGLINHLIPVTMGHDEQTKVELMRFVDAMPPRASSGITTTTIATANSNNNSSSNVATGGADTQRRGESVAHVQSASPGSSAGGRSGAGGGGGAGGSQHVQGSMTSFLSGALLPTALGRVLLYDAVCVCVADGEYDDADRDRVSHVAAKLGIPQHVREAIEKVAVQEHQLSMRKRRLLLLSDDPPSH